MIGTRYNFDKVRGDWFDAVRPTKLMAYKNEYGADGDSSCSVRQTSLGFKNYFLTLKGELKTQFECEMFGNLVDAGETWRSLMDIEVFPNAIEYGVPDDIIFFRNVAFRWMPLQGGKGLTTNSIFNHLLMFNA